jgi:hypothetical protein
MYDLQQPTDYNYTAHSLTYIVPTHVHLHPQQALGETKQKLLLMLRSLVATVMYVQYIHMCTLVIHTL